MAAIKLFPESEIVGVFKGFSEGGLEFHADLVLPYRNEFQSIPMHGQFILVQLETPDEAVLGRVASFSSAGRLSSDAGEEFNIRAVREGREIPEELREQYLKYKVNIRVLGVLRNSENSGLTFVPSHRRLPHVGSCVAFAAPDVLRDIAGHNIEGAPIGHFALGEYIYAAGSSTLQEQPWMQIKSPEVLVRFPINNLVSRRSFIFARAGFGKSNLNKLLFSELYQSTPTVTKRGNKQVPVGTIIFDPDGEYFWPDDKGRPGLCDVPALTEKLVVFTSRQGPSEFYESFVAGGIRLDIRRLRPVDVIAIALGPERQEQQNVRKLRGLPQAKWHELVDVIDRNGNQTALDDICTILELEKEKQEAEALAARANMTNIVAQLHDKSSRLMDMLLTSLADGKLCVVDVSQMRGRQALMLSGLILRRIFSRNQDEFTAAEPKTIPTIAVVEEAQSVLSENASAAEPYIAWVKEGRKYDLGAVLVTQQPGSIPTEILSQGDNWFIFHLLAAADLLSLRKANAHFSDDLLSSLLNEPIAGQGVFWSSVGNKPYPVSIRALSFEDKYSALDPRYEKSGIDTYAARLRAQFQPVRVGVAPNSSPVHGATTGSVDADSGRELQQGALLTNPYSKLADPSPPDEDMSADGDFLGGLEHIAAQAIQQDTLLMSKIRGDGAAWGGIKACILRSLPSTVVDDRDTVAYHLVPKALTKLFGDQNRGWESFKTERGTSHVRLRKKESK